MMPLWWFIPCPGMRWSFVGFRHRRSVTSQTSGPGINLVARDGYTLQVTGHRYIYGVGIVTKDTMDAITRGDA